MTKRIVGAMSGIDLELVFLFFYLSKLFRVLDFFKRVALARGSFEGNAAVGKFIGDQEVATKGNNYAWIVMIHIEQSLRLYLKPHMTLELLFMHYWSVNLTFLIKAFGKRGLP